MIAAIHQAARRHGLEVPACTWLDSAMVARRAWSECAQSGYGLADVCERIGYRFHHHALEDAKASGQVLLAAMRETGLDLEAWLARPPTDQSVQLARLAGHEKSAKHRKAEELIHAGVPIRIIRETDFRALVSD